MLKLDREEYRRRGERIAELEAEVEQLKNRWKELLDILETEEESEAGRRFHPTKIHTCRVEHTQRLRELFSE